MLSIASVSVLDQAVVSALALVLALVTGRRLGASGLGELALFLVAFYIALSLVRACAAEPLLVTDRLDAGSRSTFLTIAVLVSTSAVLAASVGVLAFGRSDLLLSCILMGLLLVQDYYRYVAFHRRRTSQALLSDSVLLAGTLAAMVLWQPQSLPGLLTCWGVAAVPALAASVWICRVRPAGLHQVRAAWRVGKTRNYIHGLTFDALTTAATGHLGVLVIALVASASELGTLRASQALLQPVLVATTALATQAVPRLASRPDLNTPGRLSRASRLGTLVAIVTLAPIGILASQAFELAYGDSSLLRYDVLIPVMLCVAVQVGNTALVVAAKARRRSRSVFLIRLTTGLTMVVVLVPLTTAFGAAGAAWAYLGQVTAMSAALSRVTRRGSEGSAEVHNGD